MIKRNLYLVFAVLIIVAGWVHAQGPSDEPISIQGGITIFNDPRSDLSSYIEFPFSVKRNQFRFLPVEGTDWLKATIFSELIISDTLGVHIDSTSTYFYTRVDDLQKASDENVKLFNNLSIALKPGVYRAVLTVVDVVTKREGSFIYNRIEIDPLVRDRLCMSSLELAYNIRNVDDSTAGYQSHLVKNGREIIPCPMGIYSEADTNIYIYAELYNLSYNAEQPDSFNLAYRIYDDKGALYFDYGDITIGKPGSTAVIANSLDFSSWKPGRYEVRMIAKDLATGANAESSKNFIIFPKAGLDQMSNFVTYSFASPLDTASLETKTNWLRFVVDPADWLMYGTLNDTGKAGFADQFFKDNDPTPGTQRNEYLESLISRFNYANRNFSTLPGLMDGWRTDRGRVLLQYGLSDEIEESIAPSYAKPWQTWRYYSLQGGVYFVFEDSDGYGNYRLVHSTASGEIYSQVWEERIHQNEMDMQ